MHSIADLERHINTIERRLNTTNWTYVYIMISLNMVVLHILCVNFLSLLVLIYFRDENEITRGQLERELEHKKMELELENAKLRLRAKEEQLKRTRELNEC